MNYRKKINPLTLSLLAIFLLTGFSFCFASGKVSAQMPDMPMGSHGISKTFGYQIGIDDESSSQGQNSVLPCCQDQHGLAKIDANYGQKFSHPVLYAASKDTSLQIEISNNFSCTQILDLPPPQADQLASVFKKE